MRKTAILAAVVITLIMITKVCAQQTGKKIMNPKHIVPAGSVPAILNLSLDERSEVNPDILGVNTGFTFRQPVDRDPAFVGLTKNINPAILRFPGGTVANYYHPDAPGYGFREEEMGMIKAMHPLYVASQGMKENILENFIRLCQQTGARATYCANLLTGTPREALEVIRRFKEAGIPLDGVELGNEFNLFMYREQFPNGDTYVEQARLFAEAIRQEFPDLKLGVIMGDEPYFTELNKQRGRFQHNWSLALADEDFYDAVIVHYYPKCTTCGSNYLEDFFQNSWDKIAPSATKYLDTLAVYANTFFPGKKVWVTEWNTGDWKLFDNTLLQSAFTSQFLIEAAQVNARRNNILEIVNYHFIGPDGLIFKTLGTIPPIEQTGSYSPSASYYAFSYFSDIIRNRGGQLLDSKLGVETDPRDLAFQAFYNADSTVSVYFVNSGNDHFSVNFSKQPAVYEIEFIQGTSMSSAAGNTSFDEQYPAAQLRPVKLVRNIYKGKEFQLPNYSVGRVTFKLKNKD